MNYIGKQLNSVSHTKLYCTELRPTLSLNMHDWVDLLGNGKRRLSYFQQRLRV